MLSEISKKLIEACEILEEHPEYIIHDDSKGIMYPSEDAPDAVAFYCESKNEINKRIRDYYEGK